MITENSTNLYHTIDAPDEKEDAVPKEGNKSNVVCTDWCCSISVGDTKDKEEVGGVCSIPGADTVSVLLLLLLLLLL